MGWIQLTQDRAHECTHLNTVMDLRVSLISSLLEQLSLVNLLVCTRELVCVLVYVGPEQFSVRDGVLPSLDSRCELDIPRPDTRIQSDTPQRNQTLAFGFLKRSASSTLTQYIT